MFKCFFLFILLIGNLSFAKDISVNVFANTSEVNSLMNEEQLLMLNGFRQIITSELEELKLNSELFWNKFDQKKFLPRDELDFFKEVFENIIIVKNTAEDSKLPKIETTKVLGSFTAKVDIEKLKTSYNEVINDLAETKLKTFYIVVDIDLDKNMTWDTVGVINAEVFKGAVKDSWKKLFVKEVLGFENVLVLEKDLRIKPDYMNNNSLTLKWNSLLKKVGNTKDNHLASYELIAHFILQNSKSGNVLVALDFPIQKRDFNIQNKQALSSSLASWIYNLLFSQINKINTVVNQFANAKETSEIEIKLITKAGLSEIFQINSLLQETYKNLKLSSQMKSYSNDGSSLIIRAEGAVDVILTILSANDGKLPLNEQKILLFNRADKTFAIIPK